jgi:predicted metalloendopeptidase
MTLAELSKFNPSTGTPILLKLVWRVRYHHQPKYMVALETMLKENKVDQWKAYMRFIEQSIKPIVYRY